MLEPKKKPLFGPIDVFVINNIHRGPNPKRHLMAIKHKILNPINYGTNYNLPARALSPIPTRCERGGVNVSIHHSADSP